MRTSFVTLALVVLAGCSGGGDSSGTTTGHPASSSGQGGAATTASSSSSTSSTGGGGAIGRGGAGGSIGTGGAGGSIGTGGAGGSIGTGGAGGSIGTGGAGGGAGGAGGAGAGGACPGVDSEPNNGEVFATPLPGIDDCDGSGSSIDGVVGGTDPDFFQFTGQDTNWCAVDPTAETSAVGVRLCIFIACVEGATQVKSCSAGTLAQSPAGLPGCCSDFGSVSADISCTGFGDAATVYIRVDAPKNTPCTPYTVAYHY